MSDLLALYDLPDARRRLLRLRPELKRTLDLTMALQAAQIAGQFDADTLRRADEIAAALRKALVQYCDVAAPAIDQKLGLLRLKRGARDADLVFSWPYNQTGTGMVLLVGPAANEALARLAAWDAPTAAVTADDARDPVYPGDLTADVVAIVSGVALKAVTA